MIVRDLFVNEEIYHWSDVCGDLPYCFTLVLMIDVENMGLQEIRVNDISTIFHSARELHPPHHRRRGLGSGALGHSDE